MKPLATIVTPALAPLARGRILPLLFSALLAATGCGTDTEPVGSDADVLVAGDGGASDALLVFEYSDATSDGNVAWKDSFATLSTCTPPAGGFVAPKLEEQKGTLRLLPSAVATPIGAVERVEIAAFGSDGKLDTKAAGQPALVGEAGLAVVEVGPMVEGVAVAKVRVDVAGPTKLTATLGADTTSLSLHGYEAKLPLVELKLSEANLAAILAEPQEKIWVPAELSVDGTVYQAKARLHGGSSRYYAKESFRIDLEGGKKLPDGRRKLIYRAEYVDKTLLRNALALDFIRGATPLPVSDDRFVHFRINERYWGVMHEVERIDRDFLAKRGLEPDGSLYEADPPLEFSSPGGNFTPLPDLERYRTVYQHHAGPWEHDDLIVFIADFLQRPESEISADLDRVVAVDEILAYLATMVVLQNQDMIRKNYYFYRPVAGADRRWRFIPWDLDITFGHLWTEENDILDENIFHDGEPLVGKNFGHPYYNELIDHIYTQPVLLARLRAFVQHLIDGPFRSEVLSPRIDALACQIGADLVIDPQKRAENDELAQRAQELKDYVAARRTWLQTWLKEAP